MLVGKFALKCSLNEYSIKSCHIKIEQYPDNNKVSYVHKFAAKFKEMIQKQFVDVQISQLSTIRSELEALVNLYFLPDDAIKLAMCDNDVKNENNLEDISYINSTKLTSSLKLNCIYYITRSLDINAVLN